MVYIVLGMHKSGTTLMSQIMHLSGINMVENFDPSQSYETVLGKMERREVVSINNDILDSNNLDSLDIKELSQSYVLPPEIVTRIKNLITFQNKSFINWGMKDPRLCLTYHLWKKYLPPHKIIVVFRNPSEVINHYRQYYNGIHKFIQTYKALTIYRINNTQVLRILDESIPSIIINFEDLMESDKMLNVIAKFLNREIKDTRNKSLYRMKEKEGWDNKFLSVLDRHRALLVFHEMEKLAVK